MIFSHCCLGFFGSIHVIPITEGVNGNSALHPDEREGLNPVR